MLRRWRQSGALWSGLGAAWGRTEAALGLLGSGRSVAGASLRLLGDGLKAVSGQTDGETSGGAGCFADQATKSRQKPRRRLENRLDFQSTTKNHIQNDMQAKSAAIAG